MELGGHRHAQGEPRTGCGRLALSTDEIRAASSVEMLEVTRLDADRRIEIDGELASYPAHLTYELSPSARGTRLTNSVELDPSGPLGIFGSLFTGRVKASVAENLEVLRTLLEGARPHARNLDAGGASS